MKVRKSIAAAGAAVLAGTGAFLLPAAASARSVTHTMKFIAVTQTSAAYRIVVEAVTNIVRHAHARRCQASLTVTPAGLLIAVTDDGTGLAGTSHHGNGLAICGSGPKSSAAR